MRSALYQHSPSGYIRLHPGPLYNEVTLAQIGLELDAKEKELMGSQGMTTEYLKYMGEASGNVA